MNYYQFHIGDYAAHTAHLDPIEDIAYRRLLDVYYLREEALPESVEACARLVRLKQYPDAVSSVLGEFFKLTEVGWISGRCDEEIEKFRDRSDKAKASANASVAARSAKAQAKPSERLAEKESEENERLANAQRTLSERSTNAELTNNHKPITNNQCTNQPSNQIVDLAREPGGGGSQEVWDFLIANTERAGATASIAEVNRAVKAGVRLEHAQRAVEAYPGKPLTYLLKAAIGFSQCHDPPPKNRGTAQQLITDPLELVRIHNERMSKINGNDFSN